MFEQYKSVSKVKPNTLELDPYLRIRVAFLIGDRLGFSLVSMTKKMIILKLDDEY